MNKKHSSDAAPLPPLALIAGPTASGKSALALRLAELSGGVIINADASQLYADLRVLTARPSPEEEQRVPHRLFGVVDGAAPCSAAEWAEMAKHEIAAAHTQGRLPILVGGTGLYLRTLLDGIAPVPPIDPDIRAGIRALPVDASYAALSEADPVSAARLKPRDSQRIARALEVVQSTGHPIGDWQKRTEGGIGNDVRVVPLVLLPPRPWLYARADARFAAMIEGGAIEEVDALVARGLDSALPVMRAIGVREIAAWRVGACDRTAMLAAAALATRRYAKRQFTWFAHQPPAAWPRVSVELDNAMIGELAIKLQYSALTH
jgi:tRNA dimethylallyltransferase